MRRDHCLAHLWIDHVQQRSGKEVLLRTFSTERAAAVEGEGRDRDLAFRVFTEKQARDGHILRLGGMQYDNYTAGGSPVLWCHDRWGLMIANAVDILVHDVKIQRSNTKVMDCVDRFVSTEKNPDADRILASYRDGNLRACSGGWRIRWEDDTDENPAIRYIRDPKEEFITGIEMLLTEKLEHSLCPVGADPHALSLLRSLAEGNGDVAALTDPEAYLARAEEEIEGRPVLYLGVDRPAPPSKTHVEVRQPDSDGRKPRSYKGLRADDPEKVETEVGDEHDRVAVPFSAHGKVPVVDGTWDGSAVRMRARKFASSDGSGSKDKMNWRTYRKFFLHVAEDTESFGSYKFPHCDARDGKIVLHKRGVYAAAQRFQQGKANIPDADKPKMRSHLESDYGVLGEKAPWKRDIGEMYERLHARLPELTDEAEIESTRRTLTSLATELYGEERLPEPWEARDASESELADEIARMVREDMAAILGDEDIAEEVASHVVARAHPILEKADMRQNLLRELCGVTGTQDGDELLAAVKERFTEPETETTPTLDLADAESRLAALAEKGQNQDKATESRKAGVPGRESVSLVEQVLGRVGTPAAGESDGGK